MSADQKFQGELFEDVIVGGLEIVIGKRAENGAWCGDVLDEEFVGEVGEQRVHDRTSYVTTTAVPTGARLHPLSKLRWT